MGGSMSVGTRFRGDVAIVSPAGNLVNFGGTTLELERRIQELALAGNRKLVVDLGEARLCGVQCLGVVIAAHGSYAKRGGAAKLCRLTEQNQHILEVTKLSQVFQVCETEDEAISSLEECPD